MLIKVAMYKPGIFWYIFYFTIGQCEIWVGKQTGGGGGGLLWISSDRDDLGGLI